MKTESHHRTIASVAILAVAFLMVAGLSASLSAQESPEPNGAGGARTSGLPDDWTHHYLIFSNPNPPSFEQAAKEGTVEKWSRLLNDPRFKLQQAKRNGSGVAQRDQAMEEYGGAPRKQGNKQPPLKRDWNVSLGAAGLAAAQYPAKFTLNYNGAPNCNSDFVVFPVDTAGASGSQANIVGLNNLYTASPNCNSGNPSFIFSYYVGTGTVQTSPVLSLDGTKVAFVESVSGGSKLHALTIGTTGSNGASATAPVAPGSGNNAVDTAVTLHGGVSVTRSSVYYDYNTDSAYVGDDSGVLHKFTGVFNGTLTEVTTSPWPLTVSSGNILTGATYDPISGNLFIGASNGTLFEITASSGTVAHSVAVGVGTGTSTYGGIVDPPIVDGSAGYVFAAAGELAATYSCSNSGGGVVQENEAFNSTVHECLGKGNVNNLHGGTFDNAYYNSPSTGHMYWVGGDSTSGFPALWYLTFNSSNVVTGATEPSGAALANASTNDASPLTEIYNTYSSTDWLFGSVGGNSCGGATSVSTQGGCVVSFNVTSGPPSIFPWIPNWIPPSCSVSNGTEIVDTNGNLEKCTTNNGGKPTSTSPPTWNTSTNGTTADGGHITWTNEGASNGQTTAVQPAGTGAIVIDNVFNPSWTASHSFSLGSLIVGVTGGNGYVFKCTTAGTSGGTQPSWCSTLNCTVNDGSVVWTNQGANPTANLYVGTLSGTGATKQGVKYTQSGLQ